jgi:hypothetical protein
MHHYYCTYFDKNYLLKGLALIESLQKTERVRFTVYVICLDEFTTVVLNRLRIAEVDVVPLHKIEKNDFELISARGNRSTVEYFWTLTPSIILWLLERNVHIDVLTYLDSDLYFFSSPETIYEAFGDASVLIHGHRFPNILEHLAANGDYNVGLLCFRNDVRSINVLKWWRDRCNEWCYDRIENGKFGDQLYLNQWPSLFQGLVVLNHVGAGLAPWNLIQYDIQLQPNNEITIDGDPLVFFHFHALAVVSRELFIVAKHHVYLISEPALRCCYLPYIEKIEEIISTLDACVPGFNACDNNINVDQDHIVIFRKRAEAELKHTIGDFSNQELNDLWSFKSGPSFVDRKELLRSGVLKILKNKSNTEIFLSHSFDQQVDLVLSCLRSIGRDLRILELGHGPWAIRLASIAKEMNASFWTIGSQIEVANTLCQNLQGCRYSENIEIGVAPLVETDLFGEVGSFIDLSVLKEEGDFDLVWVSVDQIFFDSRLATHTLPAIAKRMKNTGILLLQTSDINLQERVAMFWQKMSGNELDCQISAFNNAGLLVRFLNHTDNGCYSDPEVCCSSNLALEVSSIPFMEPDGILLLKSHLFSARVFLEFGSGGSTILAASTPVQRIYSVDSDRCFSQAVTEKIRTISGAENRFVPLYIDVGPTGSFGTPVDTRFADRWPRYFGDVWSVMERSGDSPDLILIDGRFRVACFCLSVLCAPTGCTILFDDYSNRPEYHIVEKYLPISRLVGRMAVFIVPESRNLGLVLEMVKYCAVTD